MRVIPKTSNSEITIYIIIWLFILAQPIFALLSRSGGFSFHFLTDWLRNIPIFILFLVNTIWLVPNLLFNKKITQYVSVVVLLCITSALIGELIYTGFQQFTSQMLPEFSNQDIPPPMSIFDHKTPLPGIFGLGFFTQIIIGLLIISLNTAIKVTIKWFKDEQRQREKEKEYLKSELTFLQGQISPHFFMNTLNNIHALIDINGKDAQRLIVKLSKMMRYLLYESNNENSTLKKELDFLESYIDLMKIRLDETVSVKLSIPEKYKDLKIPPLLFVPFVENAFKHGVSYRVNSYIKIALEQDLHLITFTCINSMPEKNVQISRSSGIGLSNVKKRLDLIFGNTYELIIEEPNSEFHVKLKIPVYEN